MNLRQMRCSLVLLLALLLGLGAFAYLRKGFSVAWQGGDSDLRIREREWGDFSKGIYPNLRYTPLGHKPAATHSVYPAYALPMFSVFFSSKNFIWSRTILQLLSCIGLAVMMVLGWRVLHDQGVAAGVLGIAIGPAISGNCSAVALGQFSILCAGFLAAQILAIRANRPWLAGIFWAFAMIKPQIAFPFGLLFLIRGQWTGILSGTAILSGLTLLALSWTGWSLSEYLIHSIGTESLSFIKQGHFFMWDALPISPRAITLSGLAVVFASGLWLLVRHGGLQPEKLLPLSGMSAALGWVLFYHRQYDNQMLFPLMLAVAAYTLRVPKLWNFILAGLLAATLYLPASLVAHNSVLSLLAFLMPIFAAASLFLASQFLDKKHWCVNARD